MKKIIFYCVFISLLASNLVALSPEKVRSQELISSKNIQTEDDLLQFLEIPKILLDLFLSELSFNDFMKDANSRTCISLFRMIYQEFSPILDLVSKFPSDWDTNPDLISHMGHYRISAFKAAVEYTEKLRIAFGY